MTCPSCGAEMKLPSNAGIATCPKCLQSFRAAQPQLKSAGSRNRSRKTAAPQSGPKSAGQKTARPQTGLKSAVQTDSGAPQTGPKSGVQKTEDAASGPGRLPRVANGPKDGGAAGGPECCGAAQSGQVGAVCSVSRPACTARDDDDEDDDDQVRAGSLPGSALGARYILRFSRRGVAFGVSGRLALVADSSPWRSLAWCWWPWAFGSLGSSQNAG